MLRVSGANCLLYDLLNKYSNRNSQQLSFFASDATDILIRSRIRSAWGRLVNDVALCNLLPPPREFAFRPNLAGYLTCLFVLTLIWYVRVCCIFYLASGRNFNKHRTLTNDHKTVLNLTWPQCLYRLINDIMDLLLFWVACRNMQKAGSQVKCQRCVDDQFNSLLQDVWKLHRLLQFMKHRDHLQSKVTTT